MRNNTLQTNNEALVGMLSELYSTKKAGKSVTFDDAVFLGFSFEV